jgi:hypothetical protein
MFRSKFLNSRSMNKSLAAAERRIVARQLEEGKQATYMAHIKGRGLSREGQIFVVRLGQG